MPAAVRDRDGLRVVGVALRTATVLAAGVLLAGCLGTGTSGGTGTGGTPGTPGTGDSGGNGYGGQGGSADGGQGGPGGAGGTGGDGGDGYGGRGGNGYGGNGGSADGGDGAPGADGAPGVNGADGIDGAPGGSYSGTGSVVGSGRLTSRLIGLSGVSSVVVGAGFVVHLGIGTTEQATITMDDNLTDRVQATVVGDQLLLGLTPGAPVRNATLTAEVTVDHLDRLAASGVSRVILVSAPAGPALHLVATGTSEVTGPIHVDRLQANVSGATTVLLSGQARELHLSGAGTSRLRLADLAVRNLEVVLSGTSHATVTVSDTLAAQAAGASVLRYRGTPNITRQQSSGVSSIVRDSP
ncbi:MAG: GIN domain-containing protein [Pseudonocardiaceae bacterium]